MATLAELIAQKDALEQQIKAARAAELKDAISQVQQIIAAHGLTIEDFFGKSKAERKSKGTVAPKYKNPTTGETWSGRGRSPKWLEGKNKEEFAI